MATSPGENANLRSAEALVDRLLEHVEDNQSADLQLVALTAQALATVALVHAVTELLEVLRNRET